MMRTGKHNRDVVCGALAMLVSLATNRYGRTLREMMDEASVSRASVFRLIKELEALGVEIHRQKEPVRSSWRTLYRLVGIRGLRFEIRRQA